MFVALAAVLVATSPDPVGRPTSLVVPLPLLLQGCSHTRIFCHICYPLKYLFGPSFLLHFFKTVEHCRPIFSILSKIDFRLL